MRFLVTGGAGFVGSHLINQLLSQGHQVECVDNLSTGSRANVLRHQNNNHFVFHHQSVESFPGLEDAIQKCDVIFHLAASVGVKNIVENPIHCVENNVFVTAQMLRLAAQYSKRLINFSTSEVYGKAKKFPFCEEDDVVLGPAHKTRWAYAASKLIDDYLSHAYHAEKKLPVTVVRLFNTIGVGQLGYYGMVVPRFFEAALSGKAITVFGDGEQTRCFTDVRDVVRALLLIVHEPKTYGELINIGNPEEISINGLAKKILSLTGSSSAIQHISYEQAYGQSFEDMQRRVPSSEKLKALTGFQFAHDLDLTLKWILQGFLQAQKDQRNTTDGDLATL